MKRLTRKTVRENLRIGKSIKCGDTWYTIERFSKKRSAMLIKTSPWETFKGKEIASKIVTFDDVLHHVNEGNWIIKIRGVQHGIGLQETNMFLSENILTNKNDAQFQYPMIAIPQTYGEKIRMIASKMFNLYNDPDTEQFFDVGVGFIKPAHVKKYIRDYKRYLTKREGEDIPTETDDGVVALQIGNGAGPVAFILNDGTVYVDKFTRSGVSKGFDMFKSFEEAKPYLIRTKTNLLAWAKSTNETTSARVYTKRKKTVSERMSKEAVMNINQEIRKAIVTEDVMRSRFHALLANDVDSELLDESTKTTIDIDEAADSDDLEKYKEDIMNTCPRDLTYEQKETLGENSDLYSAYESKWGIVPVL